MKIALSLLVFLIAATSALAQDEQPVVGRYQLLSGIIELAAKSGPAAQHRVVFRIDTKTGKAWLYTLVETKDGKVSEFWSPVAELPKSN
jgi:hypothetical protein